MTLPVAEPFDVVFECSGHASAVEAALGQLDYAGTLVIVGTGFEPPRFNQNRVIIFELEIVGAYNYNDDGFQPAVDLLDSGTLPLDSLIEPNDIALGEVMDLDGTALPGRDPRQGDGATRPFVMSRATFAPRINHVAISVDADVLNDEGRAALLDFYSEVFGWTEGDNSTEKGNPLILYTGSSASSSTCCRRRTSSWSPRTWTTLGWKCPRRRRCSRSWSGSRLSGEGRPGPRHRRRRHGHPLPGQRVHAHQRLHLVPDPPLDRAPAHRATHKGLISGHRPSGPRPPVGRAVGPTCTSPRLEPVRTRPQPSELD